MSNTWRAWKPEDSNGFWYVDDKFSFGKIPIYGAEAETVARRVAASLNACNDMPIEKLESGSPEWWGEYVSRDRPAMEREIEKLRKENEHYKNLSETLIDGINDPEGRLSTLINQRNSVFSILKEAAQDFVSANGTRPTWWDRHIALLVEIEKEIQG
jgi:hypothetical protein